MNSTNSGIRFWAHSDPMSLDRVIELRGGVKGEGVSVLQDATLIPAPEAGQFIAPFLCLTHTEARSLMDALWTVGIRPTESVLESRADERVNAHLQDMRAIAFGALEAAGIKKVQP